MGGSRLRQTRRFPFPHVLLVGMVLGAPPVGASGAADSPRPAAGAGLEGPLLVTQLPAQAGPAGPAAPAGGMLRAPYGQGARLCIVRPGQAPRILADGFHSACDPAVSFDAKRILFAGKRRPSDRWNIYEMSADGSGIRQVTRNVGNCRRPGYQSTLYTIISAEPWYQITFVSDLAGGMNEYGPVRATDLYSCKLDGSAVRRLTCNPSSDMDPFIMSDGRLLCASWRRSTLSRGVLGYVGLFALGIDGTDYAAFSGKQGRRVKHMPCTTAGGLAVFVEADRVGWDGAGQLASVRLRRPLHSYRQITKVADGLFHSPSPLPDGRVLVSRRPADGSGTHGVVRLDPATGRWEPVFDEAAWHDVQATIVHPRAEPDGRSSVVTEKDPNGRLYCLNVYLSDLKDRRWMPPGTVKRLRVLEAVPPGTGRRGGSLSRAVASASTPSATMDGIPPLIQRRVLGEIPIAADGSFSIKVPASTPIELQILDAEGAALRTCSWIWAMNHEPRGCIGCHEDGELTPENVFRKAFEQAPVRLCPPPGQRRTVDFRRDVMPIIDAKCAACHGPGGARPRLDGGSKLVAGPGGQGRYNRAYGSLLARDGAVGEKRYRWKYVHPGRARTSPLVWHILGRNTSRGWDGAAGTRPVKPIPPGKVAALDDREKRTIIQWIDLGALWDGIPGDDGQAGRQDARKRGAK